MMKCPRCIEPLVPAQVLNVEVLGCEQCRGLWLDSDQLESLCAVAVRGTRACSAKGAELRLGAALEAFICPTCRRSTMDSAELGTLPLSRCRTCEGVWLAHVRYVTRENLWQDPNLFGLGSDVEADEGLAGEDLHDEEAAEDLTEHDTMLYGTVEGNHSRAAVAQVLGDGYWSVRKSGWAEFEATSTGAELTIDSKNPVLIHGSMEAIEENAPRLAALLTSAGMHHCLELYGKKDELIRTLVWPQDEDSDDDEVDPG